MVRRRARAALLAASLAAMVNAAGPLVASDTADTADTADTTGAAGVTLVTYAVNTHRAALESAAARYAQGQTQAVVVGTLRTESGYDAPLNEAAGRARAFLLAASVPDEAIVVLPAARGGAEEAAAVAREAVARDWHSVVAYTLDHRALRTRLSLRRALAAHGADAASVQVVALPALGTRVRWERWWQTPEGRRAVGSEYERLVFYALNRWV